MSRNCRGLHRALKAKESIPQCLIITQGEILPLQGEYRVFLAVNSLSCKKRGFSTPCLCLIKHKKIARRKDRQLLYHISVKFGSTHLRIQRTTFLSYKKRWCFQLSWTITSTHSSVSKAEEATSLLFVQISGGELHTNHISNSLDLLYYKGLRTGSPVLDKGLQILICPIYSIIRKNPQKLPSLNGEIMQPTHGHEHMPL